MYTSINKKVALSIESAVMIQTAYSKEGDFQFLMLMIDGQQMNVPVFEDAVAIVKKFNEINTTDLEIPEKNSGKILTLDKPIVRPKLRVKPKQTNRLPPGHIIR